jgi:hypothetical protein
VDVGIQTVSVVLPRRLCLALHRFALPVQLPPTAGTALCPVIANGNVSLIATDYASPQILGAREGACGEEKSPREQSALSASS